jgi:flavorubredoxin
MVKVFIVYDTKHGNTKIVAERILEGVKQVKGIEPTTSDVEEVNPEKVADSDAILIGAPNHWGSPSRTIRKFIDKLAKLKMKTKWVAVFDTYLGEDFEKAVKKMEKQIGERLPNLKLITSGLSIRVEEMKGPIAEGELSKCRDFGKKIAEQLKP